MNCPKCNTEVSKDAKFCTNCGTPLNGTEGNAEPENPAFKQREPLNMQKFIKPGIIVAGVIVLIAVIALISNRSETIDLTKYVELKYEGYEGYGTAAIEWNEKKFIKAIGEAVGADANDFYDAVVDFDMKDLEKAIDDDDIDAEDLMEMIYEIYEDAKLDKESELKNGDTVTVTFKYDNEDAKDFGIKFKGEKKEFKVSDLEEVKKVNPFDYLEVTFEGISPSGNINLKKKDSGEKVMETVNFEAEPSYNLRLGDKVTVTAKTWGDEQQLRTSYGSILSETTKEFTVEGLADYISDASELEKDDLFAKLKTQTETVLNAYFAGEQSSISQSDFKYEGYYFLGAKAADYYSEYNKIYMVYSATIKSKDKYNRFNPTKVYFPVEFRNIVKGTDGKMTVDLNSYSQKGGISLGYKWMNAYTDTTSMKNALVVTEGAKFDCTYGGALQE
ncbi:MAG: zinc-ribbon domain-containing protein [Lachnospiraceae bacterium]|nr:zinc-ribbon domain-containing protein [Lachnospiraceae bacterium]